MDIVGTIGNWQTRLAQERTARALLSKHAAPNVTDVTFRKQSHNAVVFQGLLDGKVVFLKHYETDYGPQLTRKGVEETAVVRAQMNGETAGIVNILWSSPECSMVLMSQAPGQPVSDALSQDQTAQVMPDVAHWLAAYIGPRSYGDKFSTSYWVKTRAGQDLSELSDADQELFSRGLDLQRARHVQSGTMAVVKGRYPKDFAPHNLHWTGQAIWGFDIEGYSTGPIARSIAAFCVLAERRVPPEGARRYGVNLVCLDAFSGAIDLSDDPPALMPFLIMDELLKSLLARHDDAVAGTAIRRALNAHLTEA